ncbi:MAG: hypothetical protein HKM06_05355 [Spirochaetales bacterium]|nr:hypothetical protein [Spirochaetales bacterium]
MSILKSFLRTPLLLLGFLATLTSCGSFTPAHTALIFALNLSPTPCEIQVLERGTVIADFQDVQPFIAHPLIPVTADRSVSLKVIFNNGKSSVWSDTSGHPYDVRLTASNNLWAALIASNGQGSLIAVHQNLNNKPKICFINTTPTPLAQVELAPDFNKNIKIYLQNLLPDQPSDFASMDPRPLPIFWQTIGQNYTGDFFQLESPKGGPVLQDFLPGHYYLALLGNKAGGDNIHGNLQDISPKS